MLFTISGYIVIILSSWIHLLYFAHSSPKVGRVEYLHFPFTQVYISLLCSYFNACNSDSKKFRVLVLTPCMKSRFPITTTYFLPIINISVVLITFRIRFDSSKLLKHQCKYIQGLPEWIVGAVIEQWAVFPRVPCAREARPGQQRLQAVQVQCWGQGNDRCNLCKYSANLILILYSFIELKSIKALRNVRMLHFCLSSRTSKIYSLQNYDCFGQRNNIYIYIHVST